MSTTMPAPAFSQWLSEEAVELSGSSRPWPWWRHPQLRNIRSRPTFDGMHAHDGGLPEDPLPSRQRDTGPREFIYGLTEAKRQHYVPKMYLRGFAEAEDGMVPWWHLESGRTGRASVNNLGLEKNYYDFDFQGVTVSAEPWLADVEAKAAPWFGFLRETSDEQAIEPEGLLWLSRFAAAQFLRSPSFRSQMERHKEELAAKIKEFTRQALPREFSQLWEDQPDEFWLGQKEDKDAVPSSLWMLEGTQGYANLLVFCMDWTLLEAPDGARFYTSDTPMARRTSHLDDGVLPGSFVSYDYYLPISPLRALRIRPRRGFGSDLRLASILRKKASRWEVSIANSLQSASAVRSLYGRGPWIDREQGRLNIERQIGAAAATRVMTVQPTGDIRPSAVLQVANVRARSILSQQGARAVIGSAVLEHMERVQRDGPVASTDSEATVTTVAVDQAFFCRHVRPPEEWADIAEPEFEDVIEDGRLAVQYSAKDSGMAQATAWLVVRVVSQSDDSANHQLVVYLEVEGTDALSRPVTQDFTLSETGEEFPWLQSFHLACPASESEGGALNVRAHISLDGVRERSVPLSIEVLPAR